jgi:hypothetical protein
MTYKCSFFKFHRKLNLNENFQCLKGENKLRPMPASKLLTDDMSLKEVIRNEDQEPTCTYETYSKQVVTEEPGGFD